MRLLRIATTLFVVLAAATILSAQVVSVEPGHTLKLLVNSTLPLHPSQTLLETTFPPAEIESIGVNPLTGELYVQSLYPPLSYQSFTTHIFRVSPAGVVAPLAINTGFGINSRGTDLVWYPAPLTPPGTALLAPRLITQDQNNNRIVAVDTLAGGSSTYVGFNFFGGTFGGFLSRGAGDVPAGHLLFTSDVSASGVYSSAPGGPVRFHAFPPGPGDDIVPQPDGDWIHVGDSGVPLSAFRPFGPDPHPPFLSGLSALGIFAAAGRPFIYGTRATSCPATGESYISFSGSGGGSAIFRVNEPLTASAHVLNIMGTQGLHDLVMGPSTIRGMSVYFTVHDFATGSEQVWEVTTPECPGGRVVVDIKPGSDPNSINTKSNGRLPVAILGSASLPVNRIDVSSIRFGPAGTAPVHAAIEHVNNDGVPDLILHFDQRSTGLTAGDTQACLSGSLFGGGEIMGCDSVSIVH